MKSFAKTSHEKFHFPKFEDFAKESRKGARQAKLAPFHHVLQRGPHLLSVELRWFAPDKPGERTPPDDDYSKEAFEQILDQLAQGL